MKLVHWPLTDGQLHLVQRGWDWTGPQPALQAPPRCTKCFSKRYGNVPTGTSITGASNAGGYEKNRDFRPLALSQKWYHGHSYHAVTMDAPVMEVPVGTYTKAFERYHFRWPWTTLNKDFKVTPLFDAEYLRNGTRDTDIVTMKQ